MGNSAFVKPVGKNIAVYLHWNGGRDSVEAFLKYCELHDHRGFDDSYGFARFCQVVGNFFGGTVSLGVETNIYMDARSADATDNGIFEVKGWSIVGRCPQNAREQQNYDMLEMLEEIDKAQPVNEQLGADFFRSEVVETGELKIGDQVFVHELDGTYKKWAVIGFGTPGMVRNGHNVSGVPYVGKYDHDGDYTWNINNFLTGRKYCRIK